jgi:hypothetical protein
MNNLIEPVLRPLSRFAEHSQRQACRNAMVASTALSAGRLEREEVQQFVTTVLAHRGQVGTATPPPAAAQIG